MRLGLFYSSKVRLLQRQRRHIAIPAVGVSGRDSGQMEPGGIKGVKPLCFDHQAAMVALLAVREVASLIRGLIVA